MKAKKIVALLLAAVMTASLAACGSTPAANTDSAVDTADDADDDEEDEDVSDAVDADDAADELS